MNPKCNALDSQDAASVRRRAGASDVLHRGRADLLRRSARLLRHGRVRRRRPHDDGIHRRRRPARSRSACRCAWCSASRSIDAARGFRALFLEGRPQRAACGERKGDRHGNGIRDKVVDPRHGLLEIRRALGPRRRGPDGRGVRGGTAPTPASSARQIEAAWFGTAIEEQHVGKSGVPLSMALRLPNIPVTRVENYCATGTEAFRGAVYAVASGACDIALALGRGEAEGHRLRRPAAARRGALERHVLGRTAPRRAAFAQLAAAYRAKHGDRQGRPEARDGAHLGEEPRQRRENPKAHLRNRSPRTTCSTRR